VAKDVWIAVPAYTGQVHLGTMRSLMTDMLLLAERGDRVTIFDESGNAMIAHARDMIIASFLAGDGTDLVFVDADVFWEAGGILKLVDADADVVAGIYPQWKDPEGYSVRWIAERGELWADPTTGLLEVEGVPAGFLRVSRAALARMVAAYPEKRFADPNAPNSEAWALFDNIHDGDEYWGGDFSFCRRWRAIGGKVWLDPELELHHVGFKTFSGRIGDWLKRRPVEAVADGS
jgi:hypothetical protein